MFVTEFFGTFFLMLTIALAGSHPLAAVAIGGMLTVMVYAGGSISGAHYNPAVTLVLWLRGAIKRGQVGAYMVAQILGAIVASATAALITGSAPSVAPGAVSLGSAYLVEILFTMALCLVVLHTAASKKTKNNSYYGLAIGLTVTVAAIAGGAISGGAYNPAVGIGPWVTGFIAGVPASFSTLLLYIVGPFAGAWLAATVASFQGHEV